MLFYFSYLLNHHDEKKIKNFSPFGFLGLFILLVVGVTLNSGHSFALEKKSKVHSFDHSVAPIFAAHCLTCHSGPEPKGKLNLSQRESVFSKHGVLTPNNLDKSKLWQLIEAEEMPPKNPLSNSEKEIIKKWIQSGAKWGTDPIDPFVYSSKKRAGYDWWSLQPLKKITPPQAETSLGSINPIDQFISFKLKQKNLKPSPRAAARTLVRRLYINLIGIPPPIKVIESFASNPSEEAWRDLIDKLLSSKHYGERWARHWMDVARFGESSGFEYNKPRETAWHYRDWLIKAFNDDLPYDEFVRMQLAGDILKPNTLEGAAAVGFLVAGTHNEVLGASPEMKLAGRHDELEEISATLGQTFLGMTVNCARCHDHKFDPISMNEYYSFIAAVAGVQHGERKLPAKIHFSAQRNEIIEQQNKIEKEWIEQILARGGNVSKTANIVFSKDLVLLNQKNKKYRISFKLAPSVWAGAGQATSAWDGVTLSLLKPDGSTLATASFLSQEWASGRNATNYKLKKFEFVGDGTGPLRIHLRPFPLNSGRFGGAVDDLKIIEADSGRSIFEDDFDGLHRPNPHGVQSHTAQPVYYGAQSKKWNHSGTNSLHLVEYAKGNYALQLFAGNGGIQAIQATSPKEKQLQAQLVTLKSKLGGVPKPTVYTVKSSQPGVMRIYNRGDVSRPGDPVAPRGLVALKTVPSSFGLKNDAPDSVRRIKLATWMTHPENALFHRVIVNRIWHYHFGQGIVKSTSDFGFNGGEPSHPDLLDWLSGWFRENGYSIKKLHRLILTSYTYQQSSHSNFEGEKIDKDNRLLWRQNPRRVEAEVLRDSILEIAGQLNREQFGPGYRDVSIVQVPPAYYYTPIDPIGKEFNRRTIYRWHVRGQRSALLDTFDCPDPSTKTPTRVVTTTPSQALSQWNDAFVVRMSKHLTDRIQLNSKDNVKEQVNLAWRLVLGRSPNQNESESAIELVHEHGLALLCRVLFNSNEFILID